MGKDKSQFKYKGISHELYTARLIKEYCSVCLISKSDEQKSRIEEFDVLNDEINDIGPMGALYTAFKKYPDHALLCVACDLPKLNSECIQILVENRDPTKSITSLKSIDNEYPETLMTIYEPSIFTNLHEQLQSGDYSLWKLQKLSSTKIIEIDDTSIFLNINKPEDLKDL